jgi:hypothetical protein
MIYGKLEDPDENKVIHEKFGKPPSPGKKDLRRSIWWVKEVQI